MFLGFFLLSVEKPPAWWKKKKKERKTAIFPVSVGEALLDRDTENILNGFSDTLDGVLSYILACMTYQE